LPRFFRLENTIPFCLTDSSLALTYQSPLIRGGLPLGSGCIPRYGDH
jgi:hypothetical protein